MTDSPLPALIGGRYRPLRVLGKGGMGVVYEVEHLHTGQRLALKLLLSQPSASVERFKREARAASSIQSDHVVRVTDADVAPELGGAPFLVMELLEGNDLERSTGTRPADPTDVVLWLRQVARALTKAHDAGIVHRDLKPENLFLTRREDGSPLVKVLDFGIAKVASEVTTLTASDAFLGTPGYMAPEQTDSRGPTVTFRADLYALGLIAFKLLTGRSYWQKGSLGQLFAQILADPMPPASERGSPYGPAFDRWFERACSRAVERRFGCATIQVEALAEVLGLPSEVPGALGRLEPADGLGDGVPSLNASVTNPKMEGTSRRLFLGAGVMTVTAFGLLIAGLRGSSTLPTRPVATVLEAAAEIQASSAPVTATAVPDTPARSSVVDADASADAATSHTAPSRSPVHSAPIDSAARRPSAVAPAGSGRASVNTGKPDPLEGPW